MRCRTQRRLHVAQLNVGNPINRALDLAQTDAPSADPRSCGGSVGEVTSSVCHLVEFLRADVAGPGARLTVIHGVLGAFFAACLADLCAQFANLRHELTSASHEGSGDPADRGAVHVERNAPGHHVCVGFPQAGDRAIVAGIGTRIAGIDAGLIHLVLHDRDPFSERVNARRGGWRRLIATISPANRVPVSEVTLGPLRAVSRAWTVVSDSAVGRDAVCGQGLGPITCAQTGKTQARRDLMASGSNPTALLLSSFKSRRVRATAYRRLVSQEVG